MTNLSAAASAHRAEILEQFTKQAGPFAARPEHSDAEIFAKILDFSGVGPGDEVLDVACGPGLVTCAFAARAGRVTGIDLTPAMIAEARRTEAARGARNVAWEVGDAEALPFADGTFSMVVTRYSFHHLTEPERAWREMVRVCRPGGTVLVIDASVPLEQAEAYDRFERFRDPSHSRVIPLESFEPMAAEVGLEAVRMGFYRLDVGIESLLASSFPRPGDDELLRALYREEALRGIDSGGLAPREENGELRISFPTLMVAGRKAMAR
ncbi:Methyltransferase domain-containing protein [Verrucomicrobium sp. GAS474]|uniref:class I SAM-dependent methyltransferase n=1 Tax=Verrucomicrobium sp. GAS474 TaxID=1882831 RepID=UPI00087ABF30|nr:class I SAM-dependent methyltransferase [Verrucomicrobium sp. GAS474]SDU00418.1 Methyltransferase domain-containing protein [Verrucomicrobium sp. GAS474]